MRSAAIPILAALLAAAPLHAQPDGEAAPTPRAAAAFDMSGYWVAVVTEDWKYRMVTPDRGEYAGIPLNAEGRRVADAWDPARDEAAGAQCKHYGAAAIMRVPGRLHIEWSGETALRIETDAGMQTRMLHFSPPAGALAAPGAQGVSAATWQPAAVPPADGDTRAGAGSLEVVTTQMPPGYLRGNGVPYSAQALLTEYFNYLTAPNGDEWLVVTSIVEDPVYLSRPYVTSAHFKRLDGAEGWNPTPC